MSFNKWAFVLGAVVAVGLFGAGNVLLKLAYEGFGALWCAALRFGIATVVLGVLFGRRAVESLRSVPVSYWASPAAFMSASFIAAALSVSYATATAASFYFALPLLFAPGLSYLLSKKHIGKRTVAIQVVVVFGLHLLCCNGGTLSFGIGEFMGLACSACFAAALVTGERYLSKGDAISLSVAQITMTFAISTVLAAAIEPLPNLAEVPAISWFAVVSLGVFCTSIAFLLQNIALENISSTTSAVIVCAEPVFTSILAMALLGETLTGLGVIGGTVIVICTVAASLPEGAVGVVFSKLSWKKVRDDEDDVSERQRSSYVSRPSFSTMNKAGSI